MKSCAIAVPLALVCLLLHLHVGTGSGTPAASGSLPIQPKTEYRSPSSSSSASSSSSSSDPSATCDPKRVYDSVIEIASLKEIIRTGHVQITGMSEDNFNKMVKTATCPRVAFTGCFNTGKSFLFNLLAGSNVEESFTERTRGISIKYNGHFIGIDSAGTHVAAFAGETPTDRQSTDSYLQDVAYHSADINLYVLGQVTLHDQLAIQKRGELLRSRGETPEKVTLKNILVHNHRDIGERDAMKKSIKDAMEGFAGSKVSTNSEYKYMSDCCVHYFLASNRTEYGAQVNVETVKLLNHAIFHSNDVERRSRPAATFFKDMLSTMGSLITEMYLEPVAKSTNPATPDQSWREWVATKVRLIFHIEGNESTKTEPGVVLTAGISDTNPSIIEFRLNGNATAFPNATKLSENIDFSDGGAKSTFAKEFIPEYSLVWANDNDDNHLLVQVDLTLVHNISCTAHPDGFVITGERYFPTASAGGRVIRNTFRESLLDCKIDFTGNDSKNKFFADEASQSEAKKICKAFQGQGVLKLEFFRSGTRSGEMDE